ncbi:MAG: 3-hydroxyacyl-[acyl-carrier-protein] dehydratase FabZ [Syntrophus sp. SKADARSKE-3]|nr:3-hydroxyacyl-[acyl-carrier-protein] dehydratase FabZ [Syntrophus sp. SKADARSKE-3]
MEVDRNYIESILEAIPQQAPFRFIDDILALDENGITGTYRFREDEFFYQGHFPGQPVTPGVILLETMAQTGVVAYGIHALLLSGVMTLEEIRQFVTLFTFMESVEFTGIVSPGERVIIRGEKIYFRKMNIKVSVRMERENGESVCSGIIAGMAIKFQSHAVPSPG